MKSKPFLLVRLICVFSLFLNLAALHAQQHRATILGHPAHRFAPPLRQPEDLRALLLDEGMKADITSILNQAGWKGNVEDLRRAAGTAEIVAIKIPVGARMPFMSSRDKGKPIALIDVLWAGKEPIEAYGFPFSSGGQRYRLVTPKPCSNFFVEDLGPEPKRISIHFEVVDLEDPVAVGEQVTYDIKVLNQSDTPITNLRISCPLPLNQEYVSSTGETPAALANGVLRMEALPTLVGKSVATWRVVVKALRAGDTRFRVDLACDQLSEPVVRYEATQQF